MKISFKLFSVPNILLLKYCKLSFELLSQKFTIHKQDCKQSIRLVTFTDSLNTCKVQKIYIDSNKLGNIKFSNHKTPNSI